MFVALALAACAASQPAPTAAGSAQQTASGLLESVSAPPNPAEQALPGYLATATYGVVFLQWTRTGDAAVGTVTLADVPTSDQTKLEHTSASFTGVISGSSVLLTFPPGSGVGSTWSGTLSGTTLVLSYPAADGSLSTLTFSTATVADYNQALAQVQSRVQQAQQAIDAASRQVQVDLGSLPSTTAALRSDVIRIPDDLAAQEKDVRQSLQDEQATLAAAQRGATSGEVCGDANITQGDANTVQGDENTIEGDGNTLTGDMNAIQAAIGQLQRHSNDLQQALAALPSYRPAGVPSGQDVSSSVAAANTAMSQARQTFATYLAQAKAMVQTAQGYANTAEQACTRVGG